MAIGNGLRPDVWAQFQERFHIPVVGEFYGSTEGNVTLFNRSTSKDSQGAVGQMGLAVRMAGLSPLVRYDEETEAPYRDARGRCVKCGPGETGEMLGYIQNGIAVTEFRG